MKRLLIFLVLILITTPLLLEETSAQGLKVKFASRGLNESVTINLTRFLGKGQTYIHSETENIIIDIEQKTGIATLHPKPYWRGVEAIVFALNVTKLKEEGISGLEEGISEIIIKDGSIIIEPGGIEGTGGIPVGPEVVHILITPDKFMSKTYTDIIESIPQEEIHNISGELKNKEMQIGVNQQVKINVKYRIEDDDELLYKPEISIIVLSHPETEGTPFIIKKGLFFPQVPFFEMIRAVLILFAISLSLMIIIYYKEDISLYATDIARIKDYLIRDPKKRALVKLDFLRETMNIGITEDVIEKIATILKSHLIQNLHLKKFTYAELNKKLKNRILSKELTVILEKIENYKKRKPTNKQLNALINEAEYVIKNIKNP